MRVDWTEFALRIAEDDFDAAVSWTTGLFAAVDQLKAFPESGRMVPELQA